MVPVRAFVRGVAIACVLAATVAPVEAQTWREVKTANFTVVSDASEGRARHIAWQFEQMRAAMQEGLPWVKVQLDRPILVIAVKDENAMRAMAPQYWEERGVRPSSVFVGGADRHYITLRADIEVEAQLMNPHNAAYRSYSSLSLNQSLGGSLPLWLTNGLAVVLSNSIVRQREVVFGRPMPWTLETIKEGPRMPLAELLAVDRNASTYRSSIGRERFDAQSWSLIQFMIFGNKDNGPARFDRLVALIGGGMSSVDAVTQAYGSVTALETAYTLYTQQGVFSYSTLPTRADIVESKLLARVMTVPEHAFARASFHAAMGRPVEARAVAATARKIDAATPVVDDIEGMLFDGEQQADPAAEAFTRATGAGSTSYWSYYRLATLRSRAGMGADTAAVIQPLLERATTLEPSFAPAYSFLSTVQVNQGQIEPAIVSVRRAIEIDPSDVSNRLLLTRVLMRANQSAEALKVAREALPLARNPQERAMVESMIEAASR